jgi:hypothetical protein
MAMKLNGVDTITIKKHGRWSSNTFLDYKQEQIGALTAGVATKMSRYIPFYNITPIPHASHNSGNPQTQITHQTKHHSTFKRYWHDLAFSGKDRQLLPPSANDARANHTNFTTLHMGHLCHPTIAHNQMGWHTLGGRLHPLLRQPINPILVCLEAT